MVILGNGGNCGCCHMEESRPFVMESLGVKVWACSQSCAREIINNSLALAV
jgi:hypothetical protein